METAKQAILNPVATASTIVDAAKSAITAEPESTVAESEMPPVQPDETPIDPSAVKHRLERKLSNRPDQNDLVEKNILKSQKVAPALQAKQEELKRAQVADTIERSLQERQRQMSQLQEGTETPPPQPDESHIDTEASAAKLEKSLQARPEPKDLVDRNILKDSKVAPGLQAIEEGLKRSQLEDKLEHMLQQRPKAGELVSEGIISKDEAPTSQA